MIRKGVVRRGVVRKAARRFLALALAAYSFALASNIAYGLRTPAWAADPAAITAVPDREALAAGETLEPDNVAAVASTSESLAPAAATAPANRSLESAEVPRAEIPAAAEVYPAEEWMAEEWAAETHLETTTVQTPQSEPVPMAQPPFPSVPHMAQDTEPEQETTLESPPVQEPEATQNAVEEPDSGPDPAIEAMGEDSLPSDSPVALAELFLGLSPEQAKRSQMLMEADRHFLAGDHAAANTLYRQAKESKWLAEMTLGEAIVPITNPEDLPPAGRVYWREAQAGLESGFPSRVLVPLELLVKDYPDFLPAQSLYVRYLVQQERIEEAEQLLESVALRFPYHPDILRSQIQLQMAQEKWIESAITANQFALLNPEHPEAAAMEQLAQENFNRFRGQINANLTRNLVGNIITGAASYLLTGGLFGPFTAVNSGILMMQGENALGQQVADQVKRQLPIVTDPEVRDYVNEVGHKLAALAGRDEFNYAFEVVMDDSLNAFALPGGKIFIHAGAITNSYSEAELAGLLGHEISHAVLSHGFQMVTQGNLTASLAAFIPIPQVANIAANLIVASYSRDMERQSDILGTKLLSTGNYAADGLHNLMSTLEEEYGNRSVTWFSSHPNPGERVSYLKQLIDQGGFERYTYEGVEKHLNVRKKTLQLINEYRLENSRQDKRPRR